jgi:hypothetical protein
VARCRRHTIPQGHHNAAALTISGRIANVGADAGNAIEGVTPVQPQLLRLTLAERQKNAYICAAALSRTDGYARRGTPARHGDLVKLVANAMRQAPLIDHKASAVPPSGHQ